MLCRLAKGLAYDAYNLLKCLNLWFHSPLFLFINFFIEREIIAIKKNTVPTSWRPSMPNKLSDKYIAIARIIKTQNSYFFKNLIIF